jgi:hypothetical protein
MCRMISDATASAAIHLWAVNRRDHEPRAAPD